jgi:hypothetical protein
VPSNSVQGIYKVVLALPDGRKTALAESVRIIDPERHQGVVVPQYERWLYLVDRDGIPMKDVGGDLGYVRHPLVATYYAMCLVAGSPPELGPDVRERMLQRILDWLLSQCEPGPNDSLLVRNGFPLASYGLQGGWISGLTQGRFAEVCLWMFKATGDATWRDRARAACRIMFVPVREGGLLAVDRFGDCCIEEYPIEPPNWALNGIGSAIASLRKIDQAIGIEGAERLILRVADSLDHKMDLFDCPDAPGSRVQLALPYSVTMAPSKGIGTIRIDGIEVSGPDGIPVHLDLPRAFADSIERGECGLEGGSMTLTGRQTSFAVTLDGNRDPRLACDRTPHTIRFRWRAVGQGRVALWIACGHHKAELPSVHLESGGDENTVAFDATQVVPGGIGRIARFDETYHETNLIWMHDISGGGMRPRSRHAMRRWVLSFCTGLGRVPVCADDAMRADIERAMAEREASASSRSVLERTLLAEAAANQASGGGACVEAVTPRVLDITRPVVRVLGIGFTGVESADWSIDGEVEGGDAACRLVAGDEIQVTLPAQARGEVRLTVRRSGVVLAEERILIQEVGAMQGMREVSS